MLLIDVFTAYVICGAGALVGAGLLRLADSQEPQAAAAMRICRRGLTVLGISLMAFTAQGIIALPILQVLVSVGTLVGLVCSAWGLGLLSGQVVSARVMWLLMFAVALLPVVSVSFGVNVLAKALAVGLLLVSVLNVFMLRLFLTEPPNAAARVLGLAMAALAISSVPRLAWTLHYEGPALPHLLHLPPYAQAAMAIFYGVLPALVATMMLLLVNARLQQLLTLRATTDELTGASSRRALHELAPGQIERSERRHQQTAVIMLDLDHFKTINDRFGHSTGDAVLKATVQLWRESLRTDSVLARYGGEEFVALVPVEDTPVAQQVAQRLCNAIADAPWATLTPSGVSITTSVGDTLLRPEEPLDAALQRADAALYDAKKEGRNRVVVSSQQWGIRV